MHLTPSPPKNSSFVEHQYAHPIRLVTDSYREAFAHPSDD